MGKEIRIKVTPTKAGTSYDANRGYKLLDYIVVSDSTVYICKKVDAISGVCKGHELTDTEYWDKNIDLSQAVSNAEEAVGEASKATEDARLAADLAIAAAKKVGDTIDVVNSAVSQSSTATDKANKAAQNANTKATEASNVNASITADNSLVVTDRNGESKSLPLVTTVMAEQTQSDVARIKQSMGIYSDRADIRLTAKETNVAISANGVRMGKSGWATAEFVAELGNIYLFKPGETSADVCVFAEYIDKVETRAIDYAYTYDGSGRVLTAKATYNGKTYLYTYDYSGAETVITDQTGSKIPCIPSVYTTTVGTYQPMTILNADAELPADGYCRFVSNFTTASSIRIVVSYKMDSADLMMKVVRDGSTANMCSQLARINKKVDEVSAKLPTMRARVVPLKDTNVGYNGKTIRLKKGKTYWLEDVYQFSFGYGKDNIIVFDAKYNGKQKMIRWWTEGQPIRHLDVSGWDTSEMTSLDRAFHYCTRLKELDTSGWDTSRITTLGGAFTACSELEEIIVDFWDVSNVIDMMNTFSGCYKLTRLNVADWDVSNVTNMSSLFSGCQSVQALDVSKWDVSNVTNMSSLFSGCQSVQALDVSKWDVSNVTNMKSMFEHNKTLTTLDIASFDLSSCKNISYMFYNMTNLQTLTFGEGFGKMMDECGTLDLSWLQQWRNDSVKSLLNLYDRKANGLGVITIKLHANTKAVLGEEGIAQLTAKGYTIA